MNITEAAAQKAANLLKAEGIAENDHFLRIAVQPGGCSGLRYQLFFDNRNLEGDTTIENDYITLRIDRMSKPYLENATIDFIDTLNKSGFTIDNPDAGGSCACGESFY